MLLQGQRVVIIGGSSGIGLMTAKRAKEEGAHVIIASRSLEKLQRAQAALGSDVEVYALDQSREEDLKNFFEQLTAPIDHLILTAAQTASTPFLQTDTADVHRLFDSKFFGQYNAVKYAAPKLADHASVTLFSGIVAYKATVGAAALGAVNAAVATLGQVLALELAPIRVNVVSPGIIDTPSRHGMPEEARKQFYASVAAKLPVQRAGQAEDVAAGVLYLMTNRFVTGTVLHVEGGGAL